MDTIQEVLSTANPKQQLIFCMALYITAPEDLPKADLQDLMDDIERLEQDSYVQTIYKMIEGLNKVRDDLWWELVLPLTTKDFTLFDKIDNVDVVQLKWPQNTITTRGHFDKFSLNTSFVK